MVIKSLRSVERYPSAVVVSTAPFAPRSMLVATSNSEATIDFSPPEITLQINEVSFSVAPGVRVRATAIDPIDPSDFTHWMEGQVVSYDGRKLVIWGDTVNASAKGETYSKWNVGVIGQKGEKGERGEIGPKGDTAFGGPTGPTGETGAPGLNGAPGAIGLTGPTGTAATITVGPTTTTAPGVDADVIASGTAQARVLNFSIPRGPIGPTGETGATGNKGVDGTSVTILGSFTDLPTLIATHPPATANPGDGAIIAGDLWFFNGTTYENAGPIQGPVGPTGPQGLPSTIPGPTGVTGQSITGPTGATGDPGVVLTVAHPFTVTAGELGLSVAYPLLVNTSHALAINPAWQPTIDDGTY